MDAGRRGEQCSPVEFYGCEKWHGRTLCAPTTQLPSIFWCVVANTAPANGWRAQITVMNDRNGWSGCFIGQENKYKIGLDFIPPNVLESFLQSNAICGSAGIGRQARLRCVCL